MRELLVIAVAASLVSLYFEQRHKKKLKEIKINEFNKEAKMRLDKSLHIKKEEIKEADIEEISEKE